MFKSYHGINRHMEQDSEHRTEPTLLHGGSWMRLLPPIGGRLLSSRLSKLLFLMGDTSVKLMGHFIDSTWDALKIQ